jgi:outer membrane protein assembly factor BamB
VKLVPGRGGVSAQRVYKTDDMKNHHGGMVALDGHIYGSNDPGILTCLEMLTGKVAWRERSVGKGAVTYADGHIYLRSENGPVALVEAKPEGYREKGRFDQPRRSGANAWPHPVVARGRLFLRDQDVLLCYDVRDRLQASR